MNRVFKIKIISPVFDELYHEYEKYFGSHSSENQLLRELKKIQGLANEADQGGRKNGHVMAKVLNKALPLVKMVDSELFIELKQNMAHFQHLYTVDMANEIGNTFLPFLRRSINIVDQAVKYLEVEEKFPKYKEMEKRKETEDIKHEKSIQINDSQLHFWQGDNVGRDKIEQNQSSKDKKGWLKPQTIIALIVLIIAIISIPWWPQVIRYFSEQENKALTTDLIQTKKDSDNQPVRPLEPLETDRGVGELSNYPEITKEVTTLDQSIFSIIHEHGQQEYSSMLDRQVAFKRYSGMQTQTEIAFIAYIEEDINGTGISVLLRSVDQYDGNSESVWCSFNEQWTQKLSTIDQDNFIKFNGIVMNYSSGIVVFGNCNLE